MIRRLAIVHLFASLLAAPVAHAAGALPLSYGGRLTDAAGQPVAGPADLALAFFGSASGTDQLGATQSFPATTLHEGAFQLDLALTAAALHAVFAAADQPVWVEVRDLTHARTYPRQRFNVVPYALKVPVDATTLTYDASGNLKVADDVVAGAKLQGRAISTNAPATGDFLKWNATSSSWEPGGVAGASGGTMTSLTLGAALSGSSNPITTSGTVDVANGGITDAKLASGLDPAKLSPGTVSAAELGYLDGVTSALQTQLNGKAASSHTHPAGDIASGTVDNTEFSYLDGVTSALQTQLNGKAATSHGHAATDIGGGAVDNTEFSYLDGVTSSLQTQINGKAATSHTHAMADVTTGSLAATRVGGGAVDNTEFSYLDGVTSALQTQLNAKAASSHTHAMADVSTGSLAATRVGAGTVDDTELGYLDGVTSAVQTQLNAKAASSHTHAMADVSTGSLAATRVGAGTVDDTELGYLDGVTSALQTQLNAKTTSGAIVNADVAANAAIAQSKIATLLADLSLLARGTVEGRLTLLSGTPVVTSDQTAKATLYFSPYMGNRIALYDTVGSRWYLLAFTEASYSLGATAANTNYDVFAYDNAGTLTLDLVAWTNGTTRATALATQDGIYVKSGAASRRYVGTVRTTSVAGQAEDSANRRFVWNHYNRLPQKLSYIVSGSWSYGTAAYRPANNNTAARVELVIGLQVSTISLETTLRAGPASGGTSTAPLPGIGEDSTTAATEDGHDYCTTDADTCASRAWLTKMPTAGYHYYQWLEYNAGGYGSYTHYADPEGLSGLIH